MRRTEAFRATPAVSFQPPGCPAAGTTRVPILLVDHQPARLLSYEAVLSGLGLLCVRAHSGQEALRLLFEQEFALILLDVEMSGMNGFDTARLIREHPHMVHVPIIFIAGGQLSEFEQLKAYELGAIDYLTVPLVPEILRSKVAVLAGLYRRSRDLESLNASLEEARAVERAEEALRQSERLFRATIEEAHVGVTRTAPGGYFEYVNQAFCDMLGYSADELLHKNWRDITYPTDLALDEPLAKRLFAGEIPYYNLEKRYIRKDGALVWVALFANRILDDLGRPCRGVGLAVDVTARKRAERALHSSQERLWLAKEAAGLGTFDWDLRTGQVSWDNRCRELWGVPAEEPINYDLFFSGLHPDDRESTQRAIDRALDPSAAGQYSAAYRVVHRGDGRLHWIEAFGRVFFEHNEAVRMVGTVQDATERRSAEERLRQSEERFRELANNIDQFAWTCDEHGLASWYNDRWYEYTGTRFDDMTGEGWSRCHHPEHIERVVAHWQECMKAGQTWEDTYPLRGSDGNYRWFLSRAVPIRDADGQVIRWFGTNTDVTELRRLQEALIVGDRRKDEFLAMLAHELRNPVAPIRSAAEILRQLPHDARQRPLIDMVHRQTQQLARLLDDLLDVARITRGRIELQRAPQEVTACVELAVETVEPLIRARRHRLRVAASFQPLQVLVDKVRMVQCIANVLSNAAKYTEPGGEIRVESRAEGGEAVIDVSDTGIGIAAELLPHVFDRFVPSERTPDRMQGGLGLGLSICKQLTEMHGGRILAESEGVGRGSRFSLRLPLSGAANSTPEGAAHTAAARAAAEPASPSASAEGRPCRVLIVDDNRDAADSLAMLLQLNGHVTQTAYSPEQALELGATFEPHIVLLDIGLPRMDGHEVARRMRAAGSRARLIALSGYGQSEDQARSLAAGFDAHLTKPVDPAVLSGLFAAV